MRHAKLRIPNPYGGNGHLYPRLKNAVADYLEDRYGYAYRATRPAERLLDWAGKDRRVPAVEQSRVIIAAAISARHAK